MILFCAVKGCLNKFCNTKGSSEISYHKFPNHPERLKKWIRFCGWNDGWKPRHNQGICSRHFEPSCFGGQFKRRRKLKTTAIPSMDAVTSVVDSVQSKENCNGKNEEINEYQVYGNPRDITVTEEYAKNECNSYQPDAEFEVAQALDINLCRICRSVLLADAKSLVAQAVAGKSYGDIIVEMLNIPVPCNNDENLRICQKCSCLIEDIHSFANLCRESLTQMLDSSHVNTVNATEIEEQDVMEKGAILEIEIEPVDCQADVAQLDPLSEFAKVKSKQCDICGVFIKQDLQLHKKTHFNVSVKCEVCGKIYSNARQLQVHMNIHTKNIPYPCQYCDKIFYVWRSQKDHEQTHLDKINNVEHRCTKCDNVYATKKQLEVHFKLKHLGIRKYDCKQCNFKTNQKDRLLHHVRATHTDKRPYGCTVCDNTTCNDSNHYIHFQRHKRKGESNEYQIKCAYCGMIFQKDAVFEMHLIEGHPEEAVIV
nr:zinc finger protein 675-like [Aedes albopictus]